MRLTYPIVVVIVLIMGAVFIPALDAGDGFKEGFGIMNPSFGIRVSAGGSTAVIDEEDGTFGHSPSAVLTLGFELIRSNRFSFGVNGFTGIEPRLGQSVTMPILLRIHGDRSNMSTGSIPLIPRVEIGLRFYPWRCFAAQGLRSFAAAFLISGTAKRTLPLHSISSPVIRQ